MHCRPRRPPEIATPPSTPSSRPTPLRVPIPAAALPRRRATTSLSPRPRSVDPRGAASRDLYPAAARIRTSGVLARSSLTVVPSRTYGRPLTHLRLPPPAAAARRPCYVPPSPPTAMLCSRPRPARLPRTGTQAQVPRRPRPYPPRPRPALRRPSLGFPDPRYLPAAARDSVAQQPLHIDPRIPPTQSPRG
ncbi:hypothetical protein HYPSUDRAFT_866892 [Hypholoma sublateritium FD-334 SS-4]|uniref:Uncharacterized protein n=1 Tax=Hypholoma sublateritium (strain FD-334 SS-4) TaxID=945553 RepID=A0A0D2P9R6_HYPSF|nr:hypothetical protein HYPSUDRAFT_866892 [Hypholoma sublateritium FD-334 SS-4]